MKRYAVVICLMLLLASLISSRSFAESVIVQGFTDRGTIVVEMATSRSTFTNAGILALHNCQKFGGSKCAVVTEFKDTCMATMIYNERQLDIGRGNTLEEAIAEVRSQCEPRGSEFCKFSYGTCDRSPPPIVIDN